MQVSGKLLNTAKSTNKTSTFAIVWKRNPTSQLCSEKYKTHINLD